MQEIGAATPCHFGVRAASACPDSCFGRKGQPNVNQSTQTATTPRSAAPIRIAFIQSCWHKDIVDQCRQAFEAAMHENDGTTYELKFFEVPGAFEIPLKTKRLAASGRFAAVVAAGLVVDGGIYRHEFVADAVISGLMQVQLDTNVPVLSAVLTPHHFHEHGDHHDFFMAHFRQKGREVATACIAVTDPSYDAAVSPVAAQAA
jgi:6,7-dimethyl-8-ribityllumazine synthase